MPIYASSLLHNMLNKRILYFYYEHYYLNNCIYMLTFKTTVITSLFTLKFNSFFKPSLFLELSAFDYSNFLGYVDLPTYTLLYCVFSFLLCLSFMLFTLGSEGVNVYTGSYIYNNLFWSEREISEMHNVNFADKGDSRHLLLDYSLNGNPMLKNYSVIGYVELFFSFIMMLILYVGLLMLDSAKLNTIFDY